MLSYLVRNVYTYFCIGIWKNLIKFHIARLCSSQTLYRYCIIEYFVAKTIAQCVLKFRKP